MLKLYTLATEINLNNQSIMGTKKNTKKKLSLNKFRVTEIKSSNQIFGGNEGTNPVCSITKTKDGNKDSSLDF